MAPGHYTELFFLDEATALAAGHRPCWECRRDEFRAFQAAWRRATGTPNASAGAIDRVLQEARVDPRTRRQIRFEAPLDDLPDGAFVLLPGDASSPLLVLGDGLLPWRPAGYGAARPRPSRTRCVVLTPWPTLAVLRAGYAPRSTRQPPRIVGDLSDDPLPQLVSAPPIAADGSLRRCCVRRHCPSRGTSGDGDDAARRRTAPAVAQGPAREHLRRPRSLHPAPGARRRAAPG